MEEVTEQFEELSVEPEPPLPENCEIKIRDFARLHRTLWDMTREDNYMITTIMTFYRKHADFMKSPRIRQLVREGYFTPEEMDDWIESEKYVGYRPQREDGEPFLNKIEYLRKKRIKLNRAVYRVLTKLAEEIYADEIEHTKNVIESRAEAEKRRLSGQHPTNQPAEPEQKKPVPAEIEMKPDDDTVSTVSNTTANKASTAEVSTPVSAKPASSKLSRKSVEKYFDLEAREVSVQEAQAEDDELESEKPEDDEEDDATRDGSKSTVTYFVNQQRKHDPAQLYETEERDVLLLVRYLKKRVPHLTRVFEPCVGKRAIASVLEKNGYEVTVERDLYHTEEKHDFLTADFPDPDSYDIVITNPPFRKKASFLSRLHDTDHPFACIFPLEIVLGLATDKKYEKYKGLRLLVPPHRMNFVYEGSRNSCAQGCVWVLGNFFEDKLKTLGFKIFYLKDETEEAKTPKTEEKA